MSIFNFWKPIWKRYPNPPVMICDSKDAAALQAFRAAVSVNGSSSLVQYTGSMLPTLQGGDYVVLVPTPFASLKLGDIVTYQAAWNDALKNVIHRLVDKDRGGFIASGDNNAHSEPQWRITPTSYHLQCIQVFRFPNSQPQKFSA